MSDKLQHLLAMTPTEFEHFVGALFKHNPQYADVVVTPATKDGGVDVKASLKSMTGKQPIVIEVKKYAPGHSVDQNKIKILHGSRNKPSDKCVFITTSDFTSGAVSTAEQHNVDLVNGSALVALMDSLNVSFDDSGRAIFGKLPSHAVATEMAYSKEEVHLDERAVTNIAKVYDEIIKREPPKTDADRHALNLFLNRLLFCFFAQDAGIFEKIRTSPQTSVRNFTNHLLDGASSKLFGRNFCAHINEFFKILDTEVGSRPGNISKVMQRLPYVNGGLFKGKRHEYDLSTAAIESIIDCGSMPWADINPDVLGSMFQAVVSGEKRSNLGQHYTSVENILKVIKPLFLDSLVKQFEIFQNDIEGLHDLLVRMANLRIFDPACGSGNFLITAYKRLRHLEIRVRVRLRALGDTTPLGSRIALSQFSGIEIDDFPAEIAELSLWLAEHQMNRKYEDEFGVAVTNLPLSNRKRILCANALRTDWETVCPKDDGAEIYIIGNPPFFGCNKQTKEQKADMEFIFQNRKGYKKLDYVSGWFRKAADFIKKTSAKFAFVATNSICQGEQVEFLWPGILQKGQSIEFAYQSFGWTNNAKGAKAAVAVIIVGVSNNDSIGKRLLFFGNNQFDIVDNISPYLRDEKTVFIQARNKPISPFAYSMEIGNQMIDGGHLVLNSKEYENEKKKDPGLKKFVKKYIGSDEFITGNNRYCLRIDDRDLNEALKVSFIAKRVEKCKQARLASGRKGTKKAAEYPWRAAITKQQKKRAFLVPAITANSRKYIPIGIIDDDTVISHKAYMIADADLYVFGLLSSKMHILWVRQTSGEMGNSGFSYSIKHSHNNFPFPEITEQQKTDIETKSNAVLETRDNHPKKTIAELYDPDKMPADLEQAHAELDAVIEDCFRPGKPFKDDAERIDFLFDAYEKAIAKETS